MISMMNDYNYDLSKNNKINYIFIFFSPEVRGMRDPRQVENLQDQAQVMLGQHIRVQHATQPVR